MSSDENVYDQLLQIARGQYSAASNRYKPARLSKFDLPSLYSLRMGSLKKGNELLASQVGLEILEREVATARVETGLRAHSRSIFAMVSVLRLAGDQLKTPRAAKSMSQSLTVGLEPFPKWLADYLRAAPSKLKSQELETLSGLEPLAWETVVKSVLRLTAERKVSVVDRLANAVSQPIDLNAAARLSRRADREPQVAEALPEYDTSDRSLRICRVTVAGFRGSTTSASLDLTRNGKAADALLWGDNGVGKSTLIDGMEFALQGRVDRSADFNSTLRSSVRNLTVPSAEAAVLLSDGSEVSRSLAVNMAGRDEPSDIGVRPGFRIAPLVIRRADILRFLDTAALARGAVFFDYFPDPNESLGMRPDEELKTLEEERFLLRVAKDDLAAQLAEYYPASDVDFADSSALDTFVEQLLGRPGAELPSATESLPSEVEQVIAQLRVSQRRLTAIKKKLDQGVQTLNPMLYKSQLSRIVPALSAVTDDLTKSFKAITRAPHIKALRVLVAKSGPVSLDVVVDFENGSSALPQQVFSEGYKDLIALLFFLTVSKKAAEYGQAKILILDDALQSVDSSIRVGVMDYVLDEFKDWQLIVTGHDRAWLAQLRGLFVRRGRNVIQTSISQWSFIDGINVGSQGGNRAVSVQAALAQNDERMTAAATGLLLEEISQELSWRVDASVTRREGDRYTLGDLWPGVSKVLRGTGLKDTVNSIDLRLDIRNLLGAHYTDWADGIAWSDIELLARDTTDLYHKVYCGDCAGWVRKAGKSYLCQCGLLSLS